MNRRLLLSIAAGVLLLPASADAAYDLTVSTAPTVNATLTQTTAGGTTQLRATGPGANVQASALEASLQDSSNVVVAPAAAGSEPGNLTIAAPLAAADGRLGISRSLSGTVRIGASILLKAFDVGGEELSTGPPVELDAAQITGTEQVVLGRPLRLLSPTVLRSAGTVALTGVSGPHALEVTAPTTLLRGATGTAQAPLGSLTATGRVQLQGSVRTTGDQTLGPTWLADPSTLTSTGGAVRFTGAIEQTQNTNVGYPLAVSAAGAVRLPAVGATPDGTVPPRSLTVSGASIALEGDVRTRDAQTYSGRTTVPENRVLRGGAVHLQGPVDLAGASRLTVDAGTAGSVGGPLRGAAGAALDLRGAADFALSSPEAPGSVPAPVPVELAGSGRTDVTTPHPNTPFVLRGGTLGGVGPVGAVTTPAGGRIDPGSRPGVPAGVPYAPADLALASLALSPGASLRLDGAPGPRPFDGIRVAGAVDLAGAALDLAPAAGTTVLPGAAVTLVDHAGASPIVGTFAGLPEGSTVVVDGVPLKLSYAGGDGNDVTLTRARSAASVSLTADAPTTVGGEEVRFVARVTPATATGTVVFRDGDRSLGTVAVRDGVAVLRTTELAPGAHSVTAEYGGDGATAPAVSEAVGHTVTTSPSPGGPGGPGPEGPGDPGTGVSDPGASGPGVGAPGPRAPAVPPASPAPSGDGPRAGVPSSAAIRAALRRLTRIRPTAGALRFRQRVPADGSIRWRLTVGGSDVVLAARTGRVRAGDRTVTLRLTAQGRRLLRRTPGARIAVRTELTLASGDRVAVTVTLPRPRAWRVPRH
jgi:hypothetical protein